MNTLVALLDVCAHPVAHGTHLACDCEPDDGPCPCWLSPADIAPRLSPECLDALRADLRRACALLDQAAREADDMGYDWHGLCPEGKQAWESLERMTGSQYIELCDVVGVESYMW